MGELERRAVVALFVDVSGFTAMVESGDVEEVHDSLSAAFAAAASTVTARGGTVEKYAGDALLALFGAQRAHRDDVDRAVTAALEIRERLAALPEPLSVRAGIELGEVLVDRERLSGARDLMVVGDAVNTAARLQQSAARGEILVGPEAGALTSAPLGAARSLDLKGKDRPVSAAPVAGPPSSTGAAARVLGREADLARLEAAGRIAFVVGEPGIGKTALVKAFAGSRQFRWVACQPPEEVDAAAPLRRLIEGDPDPPRLVRMTAGLEPGSAESASLLPYARLREAALEWRRHLEAVAGGGLTLVVDDGQWAALDVRQVLSTAVAGASAPVRLVVIGWDAAGLQGWGEGDLVEVGPLAAADSLALARAAGAGEGAEALVERAAGNPLYLETLARHAAAELPLGVRGAVTAFIDSLPPDLRRQLAVASVLGLRVDPEGLERLAGAGGAGIVENLAAAGLLGPDLTFRHQLLPRTAYAALTRKERLHLHGLAADWMAGDGRHPPAELAHHQEQAGRPAEAAASYRAAAEAALASLAFAEAQRLLARATELRADPGDHLALGHVLFARGRQQEALEALAAGLALAGPGDAVLRARLLAARAVFRFWMTDVAAAEADALDAVELAGADLEAAAEGELALSLIRSAQGLTQAASQMVERGIARARESGRPGLAAMGSAVAVTIHHHSGRPADAAAGLEEMERSCLQTGLAGPLTWGLFKGGLALAALGRFEESLEAWDRAAEVIARTGDEGWLCFIANCRGHVARETGRFEEAVAHDQESLERGRAINDSEGRANALLNLSAAELWRGDLEAAGARLEEALPELGSNAFYRWRYSQRYRNYRALERLAAGDPEAARAISLEALELGRAAGVGKNVLRPRLVLARVRAAEDASGAFAEALAIGAEARALQLPTVAWRAHLLAARVGAERDRAGSDAARREALKDLAGIGAGLAPGHREAFAGRLAGPVEAGDLAAADLPL